MDDDRLLMTREDRDRLVADIARLETEDRAEMAERIKAARELGDLKENAEYHDAKDAQATALALLAQLAGADEGEPDD